MFNGDSQVATIDQQTASGVATGTAKTRYVHPDHLGSTNVVTDENDTVVQTLDFYPYGSTRISVATSTNERRKYIGQFSDDSGLSYLNARYMDSSRGQFLSQDPSFLAVGNPALLRQFTGQDQQRFLSDPQQMNSASYARDNPITNKDPNGNTFAPAIGLAPLMDFEAISGPIGWGALAITSVVAGAYVLSNLGEPNWQTFQSVDGNGGGSDPRFPFNRPKGKWGGLILTTGVSAFIINRGVEVMQDFQSVGVTGSQWQRTQQIIQWGADPRTYAQSVAYSQATGKASNSNSGTGGGGGGAGSYTSQTYQTPNGAIIDWAGNVIVAAPPPPPPPSSKKN